MVKFLIQNWKNVGMQICKWFAFFPSQRTSRVFCFDCYIQVWQTITIALSSYALNYTLIRFPVALCRIRPIQLWN